MPRAKKLHYHLSALITREMRLAVQAYAKAHGLRWGEAVRALIAKALGGTTESQIDAFLGDGVDCPLCGYSGMWGGRGYEDHRAKARELITKALDQTKE